MFLIIHYSNLGKDKLDAQLKKPIEFEEISNMKEFMNYYKTINDNEKTRKANLDNNPNLVLRINNYSIILHNITDKTKTFNIGTYINSINMPNIDINRSTLLDISDYFKINKSDLLSKSVDFFNYKLCVDYIYTMNDIKLLNWFLRDIENVGNIKDLRFKVEQNNNSSSSSSSSSSGGNARFKKYIFKQTGGAISDDQKKIFENFIKKYIHRNNLESIESNSLIGDKRFTDGDGRTKGQIIFIPNKPPQVNVANATNVEILRQGPAQTESGEQVARSVNTTEQIPEAVPVAVPVEPGKTGNLPVVEAFPISEQAPYEQKSQESRGLQFPKYSPDQNNIDLNSLSADFHKQIDLDLCLLLNTFEEKNKIESQPDPLITEAITNITVLEIPCDKEKIQKIIDKILYITDIKKIPKDKSLNVLSSKLISQILQNINFYKDLVTKIKPTDPDINLAKYDKVLEILKNVLVQMPSLNQSQNKGQGASGEGASSSGEGASSSSEVSGSISKVESVEYIIETLLLILTGSQIILGGRKKRRGTRKGKKNKRSKNAFKKNRKSKKLIK
jgi:hypothetical protein